ncbi:MAG TPA: hypothetical protein VF396_01660, partial [Bradyrhizobium sp.]
GTAGLSRLPRETRQGLRRRRKADRQETDREGNKCTGSPQPEVAETRGARMTAITLHRAPFRCLRRFVPPHEI